MVVAALALLVALSGSSYAAMSQRIGSAQIIDNSVRSRDIRDGTVRSVDVLDGSLSADDFAPGLLPAGFSVFKDSFQLTTAANVLVPVARLDVPAGSYVAVAKLYTTVPVAHSGFAETVQCRLTAGADFDQTFVTHDAVTAFGTVALNVVHQFTAPGSISLGCGHVFTNGQTTLQFVKVSALRVASLSNTASP
jgi:hypothetical protein